MATALWLSKVSYYYERFETLTMTVVPVLVSHTVTEIPFIDIALVPYNTLSTIGSWSITKITTFACSTPFLINGGTDKDGKTAVYDIAKGNFDMVTNVINDVDDAWHESTPLSDQVREDAQTVTNMAGNVVDAVKNSLNGVVLLGGSVALALVLVNQSKFNWAGVKDQPSKVEDRPSKRSKKSK